MAVVHALACAAFFPHSEVKSCLKIRSQNEYLERYAPGIEESDASKAIAKRHGAWIDRIPDDAADMWAFSAMRVCAAQAVTVTGGIWLLPRS
jgi:hypothetical protein